MNIGQASAKRTRIGLIIVALLLSGCGIGGGYAPVYAPGESQRGSVRFHTVRPGDTLYSIAFRYGLDYKDVAKANGIKAPYTIFVDQRIRLAGKAVDARPPSARPRPATQTASNKTRPVTSAPVPTPPAPAHSEINWQWPLTGDIVKPFSLNGNVNKGVDIKAPLGAPVKAAADGVVVYAGGGLRGYGKLVIVKHSDQYLSAYGNNQKIKVKEGQKVNVGQVVAEVGSGSSGELLHFEIRKNGKPANPLSYLPAK